jgi:hypothetical protein
MLAQLWHESGNSIAPLTQWWHGYGLAYFVRCGTSREFKPEGTSLVGQNPHSTPLMQSIKNCTLEPCLGAAHVDPSLVAETSWFLFP